MTSSTSWWLEQVGRYPLLTPAQELECGRRIQEWRHHPDGPDGCPADVRRRGLRARERFARANLRLVVRVAKRFRSLAPAEAFDDLLQAGNVGLLEAVERFDPTRGYRFSTYACHWIQMRVTTHLERSERAIRLPTTISPKAGALPRVARRLTAALGREPTREELADALGVAADEIDRLATVGRVCASLDSPVELSDGLTTLGQLIPSPAPPPPDEDVERLQQQIQRLPELSRLAVEAHYGIGRAAVSVARFAREQRITRLAAHQLLEQALLSLRGALDPAAVQLGLEVRMVPTSDDEPRWIVAIHHQLGTPAPRQRKRRGDGPPQLTLALPRRLLDPPRRRGSHAPTRSGTAPARRSAQTAPGLLLPLAV
jgi:RNA polymerase primary sigma factor